MTLSLVGLVTDVVRDGRSVVGYGFNSNGRYGQGGLIRERFAPRFLAAEPASLLDATGENLDPDRVWAALMRNEKPGGHGERSVAVGTIDMAVWDAVAKNAQLRRPRLHRGEDEDRRGARRGSGAHRGHAHGARQRRAARGGRQRPSRFERRDRLRANAAWIPLFWYEEAGDPLDYALQAALADHYPAPMATGENLFSHQDARNLLRYGGMRADRDWLQFDCALSYGLCEYQRTLDVLREHGWSRRRCIRHGGHQMSLNIAAGLGLGGNESYPDLFQPFGGFPDGVRVEEGHVTMPELPGIGFEGKAELIAVMRELAAYSGLYSLPHSPIEWRAGTPDRANRRLPRPVVP
jgi:L-alanine-DL-glutamate epimerase-like enolase superfamily enzyme